MIEKTEKLLLTMLEERESNHIDDSNYVFTYFVPIASGKPLEARPSDCKNFKIRMDRDCNGCEGKQLKQEIAGMKESLHNYEIEEVKQVKQPSINDEMAWKLIESNTKTMNGCYKIPVVLKLDVVIK